MGQKKFDKAFKDQAVLRILNGDSTASETTKELSVHYTTVRDWVNGTSAFPGRGNLKPEDDELQ
jgi:transposase